VTGKGDLLFVEPPAAVRRRSETLRRRAAWFSWFGAGGVAAGSLATLSPSPGLLVTGFATGLGLGLVLLVLGLWAWWEAGRLRPFRVYSHGFELPAMGTEDTIFIAFGEVVGTTEGSRPPYGDSYIFQVEKEWAPVLIPRDTPGFGPVLETIRPRFARPEHRVIPERTPAEERVKRRSELGVLSLSPLVVVMMSLFVWFGIEDDWFDTFVFELLRYWPLMGIAVTALTVWTRKSAAKWVPRKRDFRTPTLLVAAFLLWSLALPFLAQAALPGAGGPDRITPRPEASALPPGTYQDVERIAEGMILVGARETLTLINVELTMDPGPRGRAGFWIEQGGTLNIQDSRILPQSWSQRYSFEIMGTANIRRTEITGLGGDPDSEDWDGGIEIYSDAVLLEDVVVRDALTTAILVRGASPRILNSTIERAGDDGIELHQSDALVSGTTIRDSEYGMVIWPGSGSTVQDTLIEDNKYGIALDDARPVLHNITFQGNHAALWLDPGSRPDLGDSTFRNNTYYSYRRGSSAPEPFCGLGTLAAAGASIALFAYLRRREDPGTSRAP